jgi:hypothetical protein
MGIETFEEKMKVASPENYKVEFEQREKEVMKKITAIFQENAELNKLLLNKEDLDFSEHQIRYLVGQLAGFCRNTQGIVKNLRNAVPLQYKKSA